MPKRKKLSPEEKNRLLQRKEQLAQKREIRAIFDNIGFTRIPGIEGKHFVYDGKRTELDDIFILENIVLFVEYTVGSHYTEHLAKKALFYNKVLEDPEKFFDFLLADDRFLSLREYCSNTLFSKYQSTTQLQFKILYCSKVDVDEEYQSSVPNVVFFNYYIVHYFKYMSAALKHSARHEFLEFLGVPANKFGERISKNHDSVKEEVKAYLVPEVKTFFANGYKVVTFYMEPEALLKRAYVLRHEGWRDKRSSVYYQRMADPKRISAIRKYLSQESRVFINNIIVTLSEDCVDFSGFNGSMIQRNAEGKFLSSDSEVSTSIVRMSLTDRVNSIGIIDGQHRLFAYHEGSDIYESKIALLRQKQNLLVTGILFPENESIEERRKFEAVLFKEINVKQVKISPYLQQELDLIVEPFSLVSISKMVLESLNANGPLSGKFELFSFEQGKVKTASIVSFGLRPLIKLAEEPDSLFNLWERKEKNALLQKDNSDYDLRDEYVKFCVEKIRTLFIGVKANLPSIEWQTYNHSTKQGLLSITFINGILNLLRCMLSNNQQLLSAEEYIKKFKGLEKFKFRTYKTSHYKRMGEDIYNFIFTNRN
jgi:DGQHR domain-containing protein